MSIYRTHIDLTKLETEALYDFVHAVITPQNNKDDPNLRNSLDKLDKALKEQSKFYEW